MAALPAYMTVAGSRRAADGMVADVSVDTKHPAFVAEVLSAVQSLAVRSGVDPDDVTLAAALDEWAEALS